MPDKGVSLEQLMSAYGPRPLPPNNPLPTPPSSRSPSRVRNANSLPMGSLNVRGCAGSDEMLHARQRSNTSSSSLSRNSSTASRGYQLPISPAMTPPLSASLSPAPVSAAVALPNMFSKMNRRQKPGSVPLSPATSASGARGLSSRTSMASSDGHLRQRSMTGSLRR
jgi:hypothetical protein